MAARPGTQNLNPTVDVNEDVVVRQYRYLITTATVDALEGIHLEALGGLGVVDRWRLLRSLSDAFATGLHVSAEEIAKVAHLVAVGAHRAPQTWLTSLDGGFARRLAEQVLDTEASFGRFNGYAQWDGLSPEPVEGPGPNDGYDPKGVRHRAGNDSHLYAHRGFGLGYP